MKSRLVFSIVLALQTQFEGNNCSHLRGAKGEIFPLTSIVSLCAFTLCHYAFGNHHCHTHFIKNKEGKGDKRQLSPQLVVVRMHLCSHPTLRNKNTYFMYRSGYKLCCFTKTGNQQTQTNTKSNPDATHKRTHTHSLI